MAVVVCTDPLERGEHYLDARVRVARDTCSRSARAVIPL